MFLAGPHVSLRNISFENNTCVVAGGAVYFKSVALDDGSWADGEGVDVLSSSFRNNTSGSNGGALYYLGSLGRNDEEMLIRGSVFDGNNGSSGGALCAWDVNSLSVQRSTFEQNIAFFGRGGGIYTYGQ